MFNLFKNLFKDSFLELKKTKTIVICGLLLAISLMLNTQSIKIEGVTIITFSFIANSIAGFLFGPIPAAMLGGLTDVLTHIMNPKGAYFFGFTFNAILGGLFYGLFLYKKVYDLKKLVIRIIFCKLTISIIISFVLGTIWLSMISGKGFLVLLPARVFKECFIVPIHCIVMYIVLKTVNKVYNQLNLDIK
ncbi:folate family ECF transporter S component [[Clostridium] colinum]|uniref:folate family ECF transporter S component n=1 Tax=[Clostridium] colinum TaxID=36835 RepID=UPI002024656A|nr:folate family ECF transporter S component [[Clostridium] colinum]